MSLYTQYLQLVKQANTDVMKQVNDATRPALDSLRASNNRTKALIDSTKSFIGKSQNVNSAVKGTAVAGGAALGAYGLYRALRRPKPSQQPAPNYYR